ncbi:hypothetical protein [Cystobacter ferrugineus]|nr:hypothetical protein [Cystobacter ferrugineus]
MTFISILQIMDCAVIQDSYRATRVCKRNATGEGLHVLASVPSQRGV